MIKETNGWRYGTIHLAIKYRRERDMDDITRDVIMVVNNRVRGVIAFAESTMQPVIVEEPQGAVEGEA